LIIIIGFSEGGTADDEKINCSFHHYSTQQKCQISRAKLTCASEVNGSKSYINLTKKLEVIDSTVKVISKNIIKEFPVLTKIQLKRSWSDKLKLSDLFDEECPNVDWLKIVGPRSDAPKTIEDDALAKLPNLLSFQYFEMPLKRLKKFAFRSNKQLKNIAVIKTNLRSLPGKIFQDLSHLERVVFSSNEIAHLPESLFSNNSNLTEIDFSRNQIKMMTMTTGIFDGLASLLTVDFSGNQILALSKSELFRNNPKLQSADFSHNKIRKIAPDLLEGRENVFNFKENPCYQENHDLKMCKKNWMNTNDTMTKQGVFENFDFS
jgi:Leucine-rich repeat (LRR) protein